MLVSLSLFKRFLSFLCLFGLFYMVAPTYAATVDGKKDIPPLSTEVGISKEDFEARTTLITETPDNIKELAFSVRLPKGWTRQESDSTPQEIGADIFRQIATYISPPRIEPRSVFRVRTIDLNDLITVDHWFWSYVKHMGFAVEGMTIESPRSVKAQYALFENDEPYVTRAAITMSGSRIILAEYLVHQDVYMAEKDEQVWAITGFTMESPSTLLPIKMQTFAFADISKFSYPYNWQAYSPGLTDISRMNASVIRTISMQLNNLNFLEQQKEQLLARIDVSVVSKDLKTRLADEVNLLKKSFEEKNYKLGDYIETISDVKLHPLIKDVRIDVYAMQSTTEKLVGYEYWVAIMHTEKRYYFVRLITVSRTDNFTAWAQNVETYKHLLGSIAPASPNDIYTP